MLLMWMLWCVSCLTRLYNLQSSASMWSYWCMHVCMLSINAYEVKGVVVIRFGLLVSWLKLFRLLVASLQSHCLPIVLVIKLLIGILSVRVVLDAWFSVSAPLIQGWLSFLPDFHITFMRCAVWKSAWRFQPMHHVQAPCKISAGVDVIVVQMPEQSISDRHVILVRKWWLPCTSCMLAH